MVPLGSVSTAERRAISAVAASTFGKRSVSGRRTASSESGRLCIAAHRSNHTHWLEGINVPDDDRSNRRLQLLSGARRNIQCAASEAEAMTQMRTSRAFFATVRAGPFVLLVVLCILLPWVSRGAAVDGSPVSFYD